MSSGAVRHGGRHSGCRAVGIGIVTAATHPALERAIVDGETPAFPGIVLQPYEIRVAVSEVLRGSLPDVVVTTVSGCPPPHRAGDRVFVLLHDDGRTRIGPGSVADEHRAAFSANGD